MRTAVTPMPPTWTMMADSWHQTRVGRPVPPACPAAAWEGHVSTWAQGREGKGRTSRPLVPPPAPLKCLLQPWVALADAGDLVFPAVSGCFSPIGASSGWEGSVLGPCEETGCAGGVWTGVLDHSQPPAHTSEGRHGPKDVFVPVTKTRAGV